MLFRKIYIRLCNLLLHSLCRTYATLGRLIFLLKSEIFITSVYLERYPCCSRLVYNPIVSVEQTLLVLANGPSLMYDLEILFKNNKYDLSDSIMMNYSATQEMFYKIQPRYYALADPMFFKPDYRIEKVCNLFRCLDEKVDWDMTLVIPVSVKSFIEFSGIRNKHIKFQRVCTNVSSGATNLRFRDYMKGRAMPYLGTVANLAVFVGIQLGYKRIELCGVDMSFFEGLCVNEKNETCTIEKHYYDSNVTMKPYIDPRTNRAMSLDNYIDMVLQMVRSHKELAEYGASMGVSFLNRTANSMLDCYDRMKL